IYTAVGGNTPQWLVNETADAIWRGDQRVVLLGGSEDLATMVGALTKGHSLDWGEDDGSKPTQVGEMKPGVNPIERAHGMHFPVNVYPLFEQAIRKAKGRSVQEQQAALGRLFAPFTSVAVKNPYSWFPTARTPEEIATPSERNRYVGFPYTKYMNAVIQVDQSAAVIMTNVQTARDLGIPQDRWVFLHGGAQANDIWHVSERVNYHSSPAIRTMGRKVLAQAGKSITDMDAFDLYSCFPSAVQIGCQELGVAEDDPRGLTVTGGLPYFGGAGNNYVMHSIVSMMERCRAKPGSFGLVTANGWFVTKHAIGIYSTAPKLGVWERENPATYQAEIDGMPHPDLDPAPQGAGTIETYTVVHDRDGPRFGLVIGRLGSGKRFIAHTPAEPSYFARLMDSDCMGLQGQVTPGEKTNTFRFDNS
ncbi:MAG TPA: acetyl-CoA acetyltransferase, partial [Alphaproteobacteria bacterium]|nr:acetyl-CoA acetyltransferase [Alphaproteobacteria bacterium]